ncbi:unnamed protein product [Brachionus calyciflorus]|uniref:MULE transposase domain-containing protein n=1 Tax=Brachionus calyciflorus TaxID=104777 RepID=A0A813Q9E6_9BILA|nr:unnamed protein product [Brachionus calyciflorus]
MRKLQDLRDQATYTDTAIPKLYARAISDLVADGADSAYLALFFPKLTSIQKTLYKFRNANTPPPVDDTDDIVLDGEYVLCQDGKFRFILFDSKDDDRIIGFASDTCLSILSRSTAWHVDGTFKSAPGCYKQVFTIHAWFMEQMFACVDRLFELGYSVAPTKLVTDFELATINAFKSQFGLQIIGCHFHFLQAVRRSIDTLGIEENLTRLEDNLK